ncbi:MAG TPA: GNAT family N-acetyltransferase [Pyrinomonadaceae bacterium]|nr:GNAT family N-acetyltransferase [Pyrinomonadaceae bacterium]
MKVKNLAKDKVEIIEFESRLAKDFARLNYEWIEEYFSIEPHDREMLDAPEDYIINCGGQIFFASLNDKIVGTAALIAVGNDSFELAKMAVASGFRGLKIGDALMSACIQYSEKKGIKRIFLLSHTKLVPAINLYRKFGFEEIPLDSEIPYQRPDIQMELNFPAVS